MSLEETWRVSLRADSPVTDLRAWVELIKTKILECYQQLASRAKITAIVSVVGIITIAQPAAAQQDFCSTEMGSFTEAITSSFGTIAIAAIVLAILIGVAARPFIRSGSQASALNDVMSKAFAGLIILILFVPIISWGLEFTPFAPATQCIPFLGG